MPRGYTRCTICGEQIATRAKKEHMLSHETAMGTDSTASVNETVEEIPSTVTSNDSSINIEAPNDTVEDASVKENVEESSVNIEASNDTVQKDTVAETTEDTPSPDSATDDDDNADESYQLDIEPAPMEEEDDDRNPHPVSSSSDDDDDAVHAEFSEGWDGEAECSDDDGFIHEYSEDETTNTTTAEEPLTMEAMIDELLDKVDPQPVKPKQQPAPSKQQASPSKQPASPSKTPAEQPKQQPKNIEHPVLFCRSFFASLVHGEKVNKKTKEIYTQDPTTFVLPFEKITAKTLTAGLDLSKRVGTTWIPNSGKVPTFCEWVTPEPKLVKQTIDRDTLTPIIDDADVQTFDISGYRPHFDVDIGDVEYDQLKSLLTELQLYELYLYLFNRLAEVLGGKVSISAYTNVSAIHDKYPKCPHYNSKGCHKVISMHVCYYECVMSCTDIELLGRHTFPTEEITVQFKGEDKKVKKPKQIIKYTVDGTEKDIPLWGIDGSVFKVTKGQGRKWRYHGAPKSQTDDATGKTRVSYFPGAIVNDDSLDYTSQLVHPRGGEKRMTYADVIKSDKWLPVYEITEKTPAKKSHKKKVVKVDSKMGINDIEWADSVISMPSSAILELFDEVAPNHDHDDLQSIICAFIGNCPMDAASAESLVEQWYNKATHENTSTVSGYMNYYSYSESNKWFWALLKHLPEDRRDYYKNTYAPLNIDKSMHINNSNRTIDEDDISQSFGIDETGKVLEYMRGCIGVVGQRHFIKEMHDETPVISECNENGLRLILDAVHPFKGNFNINLYHLYRKYKDFFRYSACKLYKPNSAAIDQSKTINLFQGYKYAPRISHKLGYEVVTPLLRHIKEVICRGDDFKYNVFIKNLAFYIKKPGHKLGIIPIVWGAGKGSGKTIVFDIICAILGDKAAMNNASMKDAFGDFNPHADATILCVINEAPNWEQGHVNVDNVTRAATEVKTVKNVKGISQHIVDSFTNYVITCNEPNPLREGFENRRTQYYHVDDKYVGNRKYFKSLMKNIQPDGPKTTYDKKAMETILHYFLHEVDISDYDPEESIYDELMRYDVEYNDKLERAYDSGGKVLQEIVNNFELFIDGITFEDIQINMSNNPVSINTLRNELTKYVKRKQKTIEKKKRVWLYYLNKDKFLYSLIKYKNQEDDCDFTKLDEYFKDVLTEDSAEPEQLDIRPADV
jgi:hypothetical protein